MTNIVNFVSCVGCKKIGIHWLCSKCETRVHHPSVYNKVLEYRKQLDELLDKAGIKW